MKRVLSAVFLIGFGLVATCGLAAAQATTFHGNDATAQTHFQIPGGGVDISVFRGPDGAGGTNTFLDFGSFVENPDGSGSFTSGFGVIPDSAFDAHTLQHVTLNVDVSQITGFRVSTCTFTRTTFTCSSGGSVGPIQVDWQQNGISSSRSIRHSTFTFGTFTRKFDTDEDINSADAAGTYFGTSFTDSGRASVGKAREATVTITQTN